MSDLGASTAGALATCGLLLALPLTAWSQEAGVWQLADPAVLSPIDWLPRHPPVAEVRADFDGDGASDAVRVMSLAGADRHALMATIGEGTEDVKVIWFDFSMKGVGLRPVAPGTYKTLCGKGYDACQNDAVTEVVLSRPGFEIIYWGKASSVFYWEPESKGFVSFEVSD